MTYLKQTLVFVLKNDKTNSFTGAFENKSKITRILPILLGLIGYI